MDSKTYRTLSEALVSILKTDATFSVVQHALKHGEVIKPHYHAKAHEWVVIGQGVVQVLAGRKCETFKIGNRNNMKVVIHFPPKELHMLVAEDDVTYFVIRDLKERSIYQKGKKVSVGKSLEKASELKKG